MSDRIRSRAIFILLLLISSLFLNRASAQRMDRKGSPFDGLRWNQEAPEVLIGDEWFKPLTIQGIKVEEILAFCGQQWPGQLQERFGEDLVEAIVLMGHKLPEYVDLKLATLADGEEVERNGVAVTRAKREAIRRGIERQAPTNDQHREPEELPRDQALEDLAEFESKLEGRFAYQSLGDVDWKAELDEIRNDLPKVISVGDLARKLQLLMARFMDGHASVRSEQVARPKWYPPFLLKDAEHGVVAIRPDREGFLDPNHPYILEIDGVSIDQWVERSTATVAAGSAQLVRVRGLRYLRNLDRFRSAGDESKAGLVRVRLTNGKGATSVERELSMVERRPIPADWPFGRTGVLDGNVGYLRLGEMSDDLVPHLHEAMATFRETKALIVDVRGNGGGSRSLLLAFAGYLIGPNDGPWVGNVAKYILSDDFGPDHLEARYMYRAASKRWSQEQRELIEGFADQFQVEWSPPEEFSEWHYFILDRTGHPSEYFYSKPVIVLSDAWCFSATDIFLGALKGRPRVTIVGSASSGGSARSRGFALRHSGIVVTCASMASYRPDGRLYDGRGIEVDFEVKPQPEDFINGGSDSVLEAALARLLETGD